MTVFITGPGRAGTSFLVQLFTRLGFDTGYEPYHEDYEEYWRAGCESVGPDTDVMESSHEEIRQAFADAPRILKGPVWSYLLKYMHKHDLVDIEHVFMPLRDLTHSAHSRLSVGLDFLLDKDFVELPGEPIEERQENALAMLVGKVLEVCYIYRIPLTLMRFPEFVMDEDYCYRKVVELEPVDRRRFSEVWRELSRPDQIRFGGAAKVKVRYPA